MLFFSQQVHDKLHKLSIFIISRGSGRTDTSYKAMEMCAKYPTQHTRPPAGQQKLWTGKTILVIYHKQKPVSGGRGFLPSWNAWVQVELGQTKQLTTYSVIETKLKLVNSHNNHFIPKENFPSNRPTHLRKGNKKEPNPTYISPTT